MRTLLALALLLLAAPVARADTRTYRITINLSGTYHEETHYTDLDKQGFCPGTGQVLDAAFNVAGNVKLEVKGHKPLHSALNVTDNIDSSWTADLATVAQGDDCAKIVNKGCDGSVQQSKLGENFAYAQDVGKSEALGIELRDFTAPIVKVCGDQDYYPVFDTLGVRDALHPYTAAAFVLKDKTLKAMKVGKTRTRTFNPVPEKTPEGYDLATCSGAEACTARIDRFVHTLKLKRLS